MTAPPTRLWSASLLAAGLLDCSMSGYHFFLPLHMGWARYVGETPDSLVWALFALNFSWSLLVFLSGLLVLHAARLGPGAGAFARRFVFVVGLFWLVHGVYTWVHPLPMPASLAALKALLLAFPAMTVALHWVPLFATRSPAASVARPAA